MPSSTSKIPLPKSQLPVSSPNGSSPAASKIPLKKDNSKANSLHILNKEPLQSPESSSSPLPHLAATPVSSKNAAAKTSRIPDIRGTTRLSPQKELAPVVRDGPLVGPPERSAENRCGSQERSQFPRSKSSLDDVIHREKLADGSLQKSGGGGSSHHIASSRIPLSPTMLQNIGDTRLISPSKQQTPRYSNYNNNNNYGSGKLRKHSLESQPGDDLEWEANLTYKDMDPEPIEIDCESQKSTTSSENSRGDSASKRGRDSSAGISKMRRTSPDGESVSPTKTRRPSPSKIPISAEYLLRGSSTDQIYRGSADQLARGSAEQIFRGSTEHLLRGSTERLVRDRSTERLLRGSTEQLSASVRSSPSSSSQQSPDNFKVSNRRVSGEEEEEQLLMRVVRGSHSAQSEIYLTAQEEDIDDEDDLEMGGGEEMAPQDNYPRGGLHLDLGGKSGRSSQGPPVAQLRQQQQNVPEPNWSIDKEDSPIHRRLTGQSQSTSRLPNPAPTSPLETPPSFRPSSYSTSRLPQLPPRRPDDEAMEADTRRKKNYEAFVMTGDRMINLAKTPANIDFQSKYYKPPGEPPAFPPLVSTSPSSATTGSSPPTARPPGEGQEEGEEEEQEEEESKNQRTNQGARRSLGRDYSQSDDQLAVSELSEDYESELGSSCTTLPSAVLSQSQTKSNGGSSASSSSSPSRQQLQQASMATSPDTSSLVSCSEHYNGESLLGNISPQDVKGRRDRDSRSSSRERETASITSRDNRVIITIGQNSLQPELNGPASPSTSSGTLTPDYSSRLVGEDDGRLPSFRLHDMGASGGALSPPPLPPTSPLGSEEESDVESLHSYHPPIRNVDIPSASRLAKRLYNLEGFRKDDISRHLCKNNDFSRAVADEYCKLFDLDDLSLDEALRLFLSRFCLVGETQERERVLLHFSRRYLESNPQLRGHTFQSHDSVHTLTCAIMLLNTDLHNEAIQQRRMSAQEFVDNLADLNDGHNFPRELLLNIYDAIKKEPIEWVAPEDSPASGRPTDNAAEETTTAALRNGAATGHEAGPGLAGSVELSGQQPGGFNPFLSLPTERNTCDYKRGYVIRKCCFDANKKKTKLGRRGWKMYYLTLRDLVLYCFKDEVSAQVPGAFDNPGNAVRVHHSLASIASDYRKKEFVFRLRTSDQAEFLFQTSDEQELRAWVETINTVVARFSSPQLPAPCSSIAKFQRPLYPSSRSKLSVTEQLANHRHQISELERQLNEQNAALTQSPSSKKALSPYFIEVSEFLQFEIHRFSVYATALESILTKEEHQLMASPLKALAS